MDNMAWREKVRSILVFKHRNIGDVLQATPAIHALRCAWPDAQIAVAVNSGTEEMVSGNPDIDRVIVFDRTAHDTGGRRRIREELRFLREIRSWRPDLAVQLTEGDRGAILAYLSGARIRIGVAPHRRGMFGKGRIFTYLAPPSGRWRHAVMMNLDILAAAGIRASDLRQRFHYSAEARENAARKRRDAGVADGVPYAVIQPASRWTFKCWTDGGMAAVARHLYERGIVPLITCGPDREEIDQVRCIAKLAKIAAPLAGSLTLKELGALISDARIFVGIDSVSTHLAAAVGTPTVALFGATAAYTAAPWEGIEWGYTAQEPFGTRFVGRHAVVERKRSDGGAGGKSYDKSVMRRRMEEISPEEVIDAVDRVLKGGRPEGYRWG